MDTIFLLFLRNSFVIFTEKHNIDMSDIMNNKYNNLYNSWHAFVELLEEAAIMLKEKQEQFKNTVLASKEELQEDLKLFWQEWIEYKKRSSKNVELKASGSYDKRPIEIVLPIIILLLIKQIVFK